MKKKIYLFSILVITLVTVQSAFADLKIKSKQTMSGQAYENTTYIKGKRQRSEQMSGMMINITQCDLRRAIQMNPAAKTFVVNEFGEVSASTSAAKPSADKASTEITKGGKVVTTITVTDTGERKQMFGYTARHLIITMNTQSSPEACSKNNTKMQTDGWYIDFEPGFGCDETTNNSNYNKSSKSGGCRDQYEMKTVGTAKRGYPVYEKMTMFDESGKETMSFVNEVVELSKATLEASLFDVPGGYREVPDISQMFSVSATSMNSSSSESSSSKASSIKLPNSGSSSSTSPDVGTSSLLGNTSNSQPLTTGSVGTKRPGMVRIGLASVKTGSVGGGITAADLAAAVQNTLISYLKAPNIEVVPLEAKLTSVIDNEARQKECDYVIYATVSHKKGGGGFGMFGSALGSAIGRVGIGHTGSTVGNIAGQVATQAIVSASSVSGQMKSKDEITLDLKLNQPGGGSAFAKVYKTKAKSDGENIISAVIEQAAAAIMDTVGK
jgi:hypothetical protein